MCVPVFVKACESLCVYVRVCVCQHFVHNIVFYCMCFMGIYCCASVCAFVDICLFVFESMYTFVCAFLCICDICVCVCVCVCVHVCMSVEVCVCVRKYMYDLVIGGLWSGSGPRRNQKIGRA